MRTVLGTIKLIVVFIAFAASPASAQWSLETASGPFDDGKSKVTSSAKSDGMTIKLTMTCENQFNLFAQSYQDKLAASIVSEPSFLTLASYATDLRENMLEEYIQVVDIKTKIENNPVSSKSAIQQDQFDTISFSFGPSDIRSLTSPATLYVRIPYTDEIRDFTFETDETLQQFASDCNSDASDDSSAKASAKKQQDISASQEDVALQSEPENASKDNRSSISENRVQRNESSERTQSITTGSIDNTAESDGVFVKVFNVESWDVLNLRSGPSPSTEKVGSFKSDQEEIILVRCDNSISAKAWLAMIKAGERPKKVWCEVRSTDGNNPSGWVNSFYLEPATGNP